MAIEHKRQTLIVTEVGSIDVTTTVHDEATDEYVREIRIYPVLAGNAEKVAQLVIQVRGDTAAVIEVLAPSQRF